MPFPVAMRKVEAGRLALINAVAAGAQEYANGGFRAEPIVRRHFTAGNEGRYGWPPLSDHYAAWKAGKTAKRKGGLRVFAPTEHKGRAASKADKNASIGGGKRGPGLPMLVLSGALRDAVAGKRAIVSIVSPSLVRIRWTGLPKYATYHHEGTAKIPRRSPVLPNAEDFAAIMQAAKRYLSAAIGTGGAVPIAGGAVPGRARVRG